MLEAKLANIEMQLQEKKMALASEVSEVQSAKEETKNIMSKIHSVQNRIKAITKEIEDMKTQSSLSNKENSNDKYVSFPDFKNDLLFNIFFLSRGKLDLYRQLTGVTFSGPNPNCPHELKGFAACAGPSTNLKTFSFNTAEHSSTLMSGFIWNVIETMHKKNWENISK